MCNKYRPETQNFLTSLFYSWTYHRIPWPRADLLAFLSQCFLFLDTCTALELKVWTSHTAPELKLFGISYRPGTQKMNSCVHLATIPFSTGSSLWPDKEDCLPLKHIVLCFASFTALKLNNWAIYTAPELKVLVSHTALELNFNRKECHCSPILHPYGIIIRLIMQIVPFIIFPRYLPITQYLYLSLPPYLILRLVFGRNMPATGW